METMRKRLHPAAALFLLALVSADAPQTPAPAASESGVAVYFSPNGGCAEAVIAEIDAAKTSVSIAAYTFTQPEIAKSVKAAHERGVAVAVCLDATQATARYSSATYLDNAGVKVWIDAAGGLQHNKYIIIDGSTIITGSYNFTQAAEDRNAENLLVIRDRPKIARAYAENFAALVKRSRAYQRAG